MYFNCEAKSEFSAASTDATALLCFSFGVKGGCVEMVRVERGGDLGGGDCSSSASSSNSLCLLDSSSLSVASASGETTELGTVLESADLNVGAVEEVESYVGGGSEGAATEEAGGEEREGEEEGRALLLPGVQALAVAFNTDGFLRGAIGLASGTGWGGSCCCGGGGVRNSC